MAAAGPPWVLPAPADAGIGAVLVDGGAPASLTAGPLELVQHAASPYEPGLLQLWLRDRGTGDVRPLLGAGSGGRVHVAGRTAVVTGRTDGLAWRVTFVPDDDRPAWAWHVEVRAEGTDGSGDDGAREIDVLHAHDVALSGTGALRANELYVSQYLDVRPLGEDSPEGPALAVRQNLPQDGRYPWCVLVATTPVVGWATDLLDVGWADRTGRRPGPAGDLPSRRRQHEHTLATLQTARVRLAPGEVHRVSFAGLVLADHPAATSADDLEHAREARAFATASAPWGRRRDDAEERDVAAGRPAPSGVYDSGRTLVTRDLTADELRARWPGRWRAVEEEADGRPWSFFTGDAQHVVTRAKELAVLRPHGTILRTGASALPDPAGLTATAWMTGSPLSYLTRGHASSGRVLTTVRGYLGLHRAYGVRVLVEVGGRWRLLDLPSAFAMTLDAAHWTYALDADVEGEAGTVEVRTSAPPGEHRVRLEVRTTAGPERRVLLALHLATDADPLPSARRTDVREDGATLVVRSRDGGALEVTATAPVEVGDGGALVDDGVARDRSTLTLTTTGAVTLDLRVRADEPGPPAARAARTPAGASGPAAASDDVARAWWSQVTALRVGDAPAAEPLAVSLPWLVRDALVHYLSPRGLEQYTGGAWGTRDVTQGPLELLLALDRPRDARALLLRVLSAQNPDGTWPQAFGFLPGDEGFRHEPPHGDVVHWPVLALGRYLLATGDASVLDEVVPFWAPGTGHGAADAPRGAGRGTKRGTEQGTEQGTVREHVRRALDRARSDVLPGTRLVAYGHGDWNDSLQPADPAMARTLASAWTVTLHHQAMSTLAAGLRTAGTDEDLARALDEDAAAVAADLDRHLLVDGELAGYVQLDPPAAPGATPEARRLLVHPRDAETGLRHGSLQMIHALVADLLDPAQAERHVALVREHLSGVDGVRLFDRPPAYHGGPMRHFQRAETASFVGREIGLMYVHAHLRWCEAMARWGDADALWLGLLQVLPPAAAATVPGARPRQANAYPSSSDAACLHREDFAARYDDVLTGATGLEAGWRVYSSGPGVLVRVVAQSLLGVRRRASVVEVDPVLPAALDGLTAAVPLDGGVLRVRYRVGQRGHGPAALRLDGAELAATRVANPYRTGALAVDLVALAPALHPDGPTLEVDLP
ncbi:cellobiose phosphorylase [Actinotalea solisilvae]|uniref:cellobiose phosphorylase n=1 Tax=Actinotalea solisilvae TaxID=2072922 RepID=UPI0018F26842|nr:cellobiose phosphorylase [Actinotalea solisilvae]